MFLIILIITFEIIKICYIINFNLIY